MATRNLISTTVLGGALVVCAGGLLGCAAIPGEADDTGELSTTLPVRTAAWLAAELCREAFPGADPIPQQVAAPAIALGREGFQLRYERTRPAGYRVFMNGRLTPPDPEGSPPHQIRFVAGKDRSATRLPADDGILLRIEPAGEGARLHLELFGEAVRSSLGSRLRRGLALAEGLARAERLLREKKPARAVSVIEATLPGPDPAPGGKARLLLVARLLFARAIAHESEGHLALAQRDLRSCLALQGHWTSARVRLLQLDERHAREPECLSSLRALASLPARPGLAHRAGLRMSQHLQRRAASTPLGMELQMARSYHALGDQEAARAWQALAMAGRKTGIPGLALKARLHRDLGEHRRAFETALCQLEAGGYRPDLALALHRDASRIGDEVGALGWIARFWDRLAATHGSEARARLRFSCARLGPELAARVLLAQGQPELARAQLEHLRAMGARRDASVLERFASSQEGLGAHAAVTAANPEPSASPSFTDPSFVPMLSELTDEAQLFEQHGLQRPDR